jgi:dolichol-phosphate mannosyltransferase
MKVLIIIPTLNEEKNIHILINKIIKLNLKITILVIDDNSKDLTREKIVQLNKKFNFVKYIFRKRRLGIGSAHKYGLKWSIKRNFDVSITIDADLTHDPKLIKKMLKIINLKKYSIISTSRFILKNSLKQWPLIRIILTKIRFYIVKVLLNTNLDSSGGYRCYYLKNIKKNDLFKARNNYYFFLIESLYYLEKKGYRIKELPIILPYRLYGSSKMKLKDIFLSLYHLIRLRINQL